MAQSAWTPVPPDQTGWTPVPVEQDTRNAVQKGFDRLTTVTPEDEKGHSAIVNRAQEFGAGAIQGFGAPIVHPVNTLEGIAGAVAHPIDTAKGLVKSAMNNPAQTLGNVVGGAVLGEAAAPIAKVAVQQGGKVATAAAENIPRKLYESALKPSTTLSQVERTRIVEAGLQNGIRVNPDGIEKVGNLIDDYNKSIADTIAADPTKQIGTGPAMRNLRSVRDKFTTQVAPSGDLQQIDAVGKEFADQTPTGSLNAADAQAMKQGTYRALGSKSYGEVKGASVEAQKALARGLKEEIANQFPEIGNMNAAESRLLDLQPVLERAVNRTANHQVIGIGSPIAGAAAKAATGSGPAALATMLVKSIIDDPAVKSRLAISLSKGAKIPFGQASARVQAYSTALGSAVGGVQGYSPAAPPSQ